MGTPTVKLTLELKRVQTFIFEVPRLKAMLGANALIGQTMRHELPALLANQGSQLDWPKEIALQGTADDPLDRPETDASDRDDPAALYQRGILARDGGHFIVLFDDKSAAERFLEQAEAVLAERLPGVLYEARIDPFREPKESPLRQPRDPHETALLDLPVLQVCQETGQGPASARNNKGYWQGESVRYRLDWGDWFYKGCTQDIIGLLRSTLYPDHAMDWQEPDDLAQLAAGGYLALIHADGNGIGKRYKSWRDQAKSQNEVVKEAHGEAFFHSMRVAVRRAVVTALAKTFTEPGGVRPYEILMLGGDDLLLGFGQPLVGGNFQAYHALPVVILAGGLPGFLAQGFRVPLETAQGKVPELAVGMAPGANVPVIAGTHQGMGFQQAFGGFWAAQGNIAGAQLAAVTGCGYHRTHGFRRNVAAGLHDHGVAGQAQIQLREGGPEPLLAGQQVMVFADLAMGDHRFEIPGGDIAFKVPVVDQVARCQLPQVGIDVFGSLLPADSETVADVVGGQPTFPQCDGFDESIAKQQVPANGPVRFLHNQALTIQ